MAKLGLYISTLGYLEDRSICFIELPDDGIEKLNKCLIRLNTTITILDNNQQLNLLNLTDLEAKRAKIKEVKVQKYQ